MTPGERLPGSEHTPCKSHVQLERGAERRPFRCSCGFVENTFIKRPMPARSASRDNSCWKRRLLILEAKHLTTILRRPTQLDRPLGFSAGSGVSSYPRYWF